LADGLPNGLISTHLGTHGEILTMARHDVAVLGGGLVDLLDVPWTFVGHPLDRVRFY